MEKISVIIPVYNCEEFLDVCLDTILLQTHSNFEIICINDGSTDGSEKLLDKYSKFDSRIKYYTTENKGAAAARNKGLEYVSGDYVLYVDADDYMMPFMFEKLYENAKKYDSDMVVSNLYKITTETNKGYIWGLTDENKRFFNILNKPVFDGKEEAVEIYFGIIPTVSAKLLKYEMIKDFRFKEGIIFEDNLYFTDCYFAANKISYDTKAYYYYRQRQGSIMKSYDERHKDIFYVKKMQDEIFKKYGQYERFKTELFIQKMSETLERTILSKEGVREEMFELLKKEFKNVDYSQYDLAKISKTRSFYIIEKIIRTDYKNFKIFADKLIADGGNSL